MTQIIGRLNEALHGRVRVTGLNTDTESVNKLTTHCE